MCARLIIPGLIADKDGARSPSRFNVDNKIPMKPSRKTCFHSVIIPDSSPLRLFPPLILDSLDVNPWSVCRWAHAPRSLWYLSKTGAATMPEVWGPLGRS